MLLRSILKRKTLHSSSARSVSFVGPPESTFFHKDLKIERTSNPKARPGDDHSYVFGQLMTDHMLEIDWDSERGWHAPVIKEYQPFGMDPAAGVLHYATQCFEGMKAYQDANGNHINLFRPDLNMERFRSSCRYLALPDFDPDEFLKCIKELLKVDRDWMPNRPLHSLYIRPTGISLDETLHIERPNKSKVYVILSPVGPYFPAGFKPVRLYSTDKAVRAWPKGHGDKKLGGNYGPTLHP